MSSAAPMQQAKTEAANTVQHSSQSSSQLVMRSQQFSSSETQSGFADLRMQATSQRKLQDAATHSPQCRQLSACQQMAQNSRRITQLKNRSTMMHVPTLQRLEDDEPLQAKMEDSAIQLEEATSPDPKPNNTGLPDNLKSGIESLSGMSLDHVKVHYNSAQPAQLNAHAYAQGSEIHVAPGQEQHLPHEAWHVVQQAQGRVQPTMQMKEGVPVNDDAGLEHEADVMGAKALQLKVDQETSVLDVVTNNTSGTQLKTVVQLSAATDADAAASQDVVNARLRLIEAANLIQSLRQGNQQAPGLSGDPFAALPLVLSGQKLTDHMGRFEVTIDGEPRLYECPIGQLGSYRQRAVQLGLPFRSDSALVAPFNPVVEDDFVIEESDSSGEDYGSGEEYSSGEEYDSADEDYSDLEDDSTIQTAQTVQRAATAAGYNGGHMDENAAKIGPIAAPNLVNGSITFAGTTGYNTALGVTSTDLNRQPNGTGVGTTRPANWGDFIAMVHATNPFKQGHQMSQRLGGDGTHDNLAPFTGSLNALHSTRVESHVINQTDATGGDEFADYDTTPVYGGNPGIVTWAQLQFAGMTTAQQLAAMVTAGILTAPVAAGILPTAPLPAAQLILANTWLATYVNGAFPTSIICDANFIDAIGGGIYHQTGNQQVTITNDF